MRVRASAGHTMRAPASVWPMSQVVASDLSRARLWRLRHTSGYLHCNISFTIRNIINNIPRRSDSRSPFDLDGSLSQFCPTDIFIRTRTRNKWTSGRHDGLPIDHRLSCLPRGEDFRCIRAFELWNVPGAFTFSFIYQRPSWIMK